MTPAPTTRPRRILLGLALAVLLIAGVAATATHELQVDATGAPTTNLNIAGPHIVGTLPVDQQTIWHRQGVLLQAHNGADSGGVQEPSLIYENGPHLLTDLGGPVYKLWYTGGQGGLSTAGICYAESYDRQTWVRYSSGGVVQFVAANYLHGTVVKSGSTYYLFGVLSNGTINQTRLDILSSSDGIAWTVAVTGAISTSTSGWDNQLLGNPFPIIAGDGSVNLLYEALGTVRTSYTYATGLATAPSITGTYTKYGSAPVLYQSGGSVGGGWFTQVGGTYWGWVHRSNTGGLPTDIYRCYSSDLHTWTWSPATPVLARAAANEGAGSVLGQVGDPFLLPLGSQTLMAYEGIENGTASDGSGNFRLKSALANATIAQLTAMPNEGAGVAEPQAQGSIGNPVDVQAYGAALSLTDGTAGTVVWSSIASSTNGLDPGTNGFDGSGNYTVPVTGKYIVGVGLFFNSGVAAGTRIIAQVVHASNGAEYTPGGRLAEYYVDSTSTYPYLSGERRLLLLAGDVIQIKVTSYGSAATLSPANQTTFLSIVQAPH